jgi:hypothetical protein
MSQKEIRHFPQPLLDCLRTHHFQTSWKPVITYVVVCHLSITGQSFRDGQNRYQGVRNATQTTERNYPSEYPACLEG